MKTTGEAVHPAIRAARRRGFFMNLIDWILDIDHVDPDEAREYVASKHGGVESRPPGTLGYIRNQDGPENHGLR